MSQKQLISGIAIGIVVGGILVYLIITAFQKMGIMATPVTDAWGVLLSIIVTGWIAVGTSNAINIRGLRKDIQANTAADIIFREEIKDLLHLHDKRIERIEIDLGIKNGK